MVLEPKAALDEDIYSDGDSISFLDDMRAYGVGQALPLDDDGIDEDAAAYLQLVREEAARIPPVCASVRRRVANFAAIAEQPPDDSSMPDWGWLCDVLDIFVAARAQVEAERASAPDSAQEALPHINDRRSWHRLLRHAEIQPYSSVLAIMDNKLTVSCLMCLVGEAAQGGQELSSYLGLWLYGLMVRLEKPVHPDAAATLRQVSLLARHRRTALAGSSRPSRESGVQQAMYDTLLVLAGGFFGQDVYLAPVSDKYLGNVSAGLR